MAEEIKKRVKVLVAQRGQIQSKITRFSNLLEDGGEYVDTDYAKECADKVDAAIDGLQIIQDELRKIDAAVKHEDAGEEILYKYYRAKALYKRFADPPPTAHLKNETSNTNLSASMSKLPKLELQTFDGTLEKWRAFRDWFRENIHKRELSESTKLEYLQNTLKGEAAQTIEAFEATNDNYREAWRLLEETYDVEYVLIFRHLDLLLETPPMRNNSADEIRKLLNQIQTQLLSMKALGEKIEQWNTIVVHIIIKRLHKDTAREWNRRMRDSKVPKSEDLIAFLREKATRLIAVTPFSNQSAPSHHQNNNTINGSKGTSSKTNRSSFISSSEIKCPKCQSSHSLAKCNDFLKLTIPERFNCARTSSVCLRCFLPGHKTQLCNSSVCKICQKGHHSLVHLTNNDWKIVKNNSWQLKKINTQASPGEITTMSKNPPPTVLVSSGPAVDLLTTAVVEILNKNGVPVRCRALLDTCSSSNFMTTRFAEKLGLQVKECKVSVNAIGDTSTTTKSLLTAKFKSCVNDYTQSLSFLTVNTIGGLQPPEPVDTSHFRIPKGIKLADPEYYKPQKVDIIVSSGPTLSMLSVGQIRGIHPKHPNVILQKTKLGWIIGGSVAGNTPENSTLSCKATNTRFEPERITEIEEVSSSVPASVEDIACDSRVMAEKQYTASIQEYIDRRYTNEVKEPVDSSDGFVVIKETSITTKDELHSTARPRVNLAYL